ncbi:unnamed protein product [Urochloa decumbens]|uniref:RRM domain-containing protein n=1 Tax=Urochloa decumbens TaxID=240449 RepID=A0ABC8XZ04_9POAL
MSWSDLPPDLLRLISGHLREAGDFVRFHSACQAWRDAAPATLPQFLPWLLTPGSHDPPSTSQLRSIFSKTTWRAPRTNRLRNRWLASEDGAAAWLLTREAGSSPSLRLVDPFTGAATALPPFAGRAGEYIPGTDGLVLDDGTVVLFSIEGFFKYGCFAMVAVLRPGGAAWAEGQAHLVMKHVGYRAAAYHDGAIVLAGLRQVETVKLREASCGNGGKGGGDDAVPDAVASTRWDDPPWENTVDPGPQPRQRRIYTFKSRGELLAACLLLPDTPEQGGAGGDPGALALAGAMSVSVYALEPGADGGGGGNNPRWVERDARSLGDRVLFLGCPTSFAVDAARLGGEGGCAYFVLSSRKPGVARRKDVPEARRVYRYSFEDGGATVVEELSTGTGWEDVEFMTWLAPRPCAIAPVREIRERLQLQGPNRQQGAPCTASIIRAPRAVFGPPFTFFVGNLPSGVGSLKLEQFFTGFGKVTDARVNYASSYWGFGFITMAPIGEPDDVFAVLDGEYFFGHVLRAKFAEERPEGPFVMPLLAPNKTRK